MLFSRKWLYYPVPILQMSNMAATTYIVISLKNTNRKLSCFILTNVVVQTSKGNINVLSFQWCVKYTFIFDMYIVKMLIFPMSEKRCTTKIFFCEVPYKVQKNIETYIKISHSIYHLNWNINKKRRNATKPGFQRFNQVLIWQE